MGYYENIFNQEFILPGISQK